MSQKSNNYNLGLGSLRDFLKTNKIPDEYWLQNEDSAKSVFSINSADIPADISIPSHQISSQWTKSFNQGSDASSIYYQEMQTSFDGHVNYKGQGRNFYPRPSQPMKQPRVLEVKIVENYPQNHYNVGSLDANHLLPNTSFMPSYCRQLNKPRVLTINKLEFPKFKIGENKKILTLTGIGIC